MFSYLKGIVEDIFDTQVIIEVNDIGYKVFMPNTSIEQLPPKGDTVKIHTYYYVREDQQTLFGFISKEERDFFIHLTSVSGIGPKIGINILSQLSFKSLIKAIIEKDLMVLKNLSGVGAKKAERLVMELKDKIAKLYSAEDYAASSVSEKNVLDKDLEQDLRLALKTLGYRTEEINRALSSSSSQLNSAATLESNLKIILKQL